MATFYLDMYGGGNDAWAGTGTTTPKATLNAVTALVTSVNDEIRVRGVDSLFTSVGNATWTDKSNNVIMTGDTTASVAVGSYICKTEVWSGTTVPRLYLVASRTYAAGTNLTTIVLTNTTNCYYEGTTETKDTSVLSVAQTIALQDFGRNGQTSGTAASWTRVDTQITGGWNSGYTAQNSYSLCYNTANASNFSVINNNTTRRQYWHLKKFIVFNGNQFHDIYQTYCSFSDCSFVGLAARRNIIAASCVWLIFNNCYFYHAATGYDFMINSADSMYMNNCYVHNSINRVTLNNDGNSYNNTVFAYGNSTNFNVLTTSTLNNCRFRFAGATFSAGLATNVFNNCTWELTASACDLGTATISGGTYTNTTGAFTNTGNITNTDITTTTGDISITYASYDGTTNNLVTTSGALTLTCSTSCLNTKFTGTTGTITITSPIVQDNTFNVTTCTINHISNSAKEDFIGNTIIQPTGTTVTFTNQSSPVALNTPLVSGNTFTNAVLNTSKGTFIDNTILDLATNAQLYGGTMIYDSNNDVDKTKFARIADNLSAPYIYQPQNTVWLQQPSGNTIFYNGGFVDLTSDIYTGKTDYSGTSALRLYRGLSNSQSYIRIVDFNVEAGATGHTKFFVSGNTIFGFNIMNHGNFIWDNWKYFNVTGNTYQEVRANLTGTTFTKDGIATLWIKLLFVNTQINLDNIGLYSGTTTDNITNYTLEDGLVGRWTFEDNLTDSSGNGYNMAGSGSYVTGKIGKAFRNGGVSTYATVGTLNGTNSFTITCWVNSNGTRMDIGNYNDGLCNFMPFASGGGNIWYHNRADGRINTGVNLSLNVWHFLVFTFNGTQTNIYVNGNTTPSYTVNESNSISSSRFGIAYGDVSPYVDAVFLYSRVLSTAEMTVLYNGGNGLQ